MKALSLIMDHLLPETASDKNKSVLAAVLRIRIHNSRLVDNFSWLINKLINNGNFRVKTVVTLNL